MGTVTVGNALPAFSGWTPNAEMILSRELMRPTKGAPPAALVVSLFAEWCLSCREGLPIINELIRNRPDAAAVLIALPPNLNKVPKFLQDLQVDIPVIKDPYFKISGERFGLSVGNGMLSETLPRTIVVNQSGVVQAIFGTEGDDFKRVLTEALDRAASQAKTRPKQ
jgi:thiol-disulfide isomerase/thioredoxin